MFSRSSELMYVPACGIFKESISCMVRSRPFLPRSRLWLLAVISTLKPALWMAVRYSSGSAESRVAFVWLSSEGYFQVSYRKVGSAYFCFDIFKNRTNNRILLLWCVQHLFVLMLHEVSYEKKRKSICFQAVCCRYLYGNGILLCFADAGELCNQKEGILIVFSWIQEGFIVSFRE